MKCFLSILSLLVLFFPLIGSELSYSIRPIKINNEVLLEVRLKFQTNNQYSTYLYLPSSYASQTNLYREISRIECETEDVSIQQTEQPHILKIHHEPYEQIQIKYRIQSRHLNDAHWYYRPIIEKDHFLIFGYCFFLVPQMDYEKMCTVHLKWKDFPNGWTIANSFGVQEKRQKIHTTISQFLHSAFAGGDYSVIKCGKENEPIYVAVKDQWSFSLQHFITLLETIIHEQRRFWKSKQFPFYLVALIPSKSYQYNSGTAVHNAFSIFINDFHESSQGHWDNLAWLLSHEHFHTWNGLKMSADPKSDPMEWFIEGFTEYYAIELNYRAKLLNFDEYIATLNKILYEYYSSPVKNAKNEKIPQKFWENLDYQRLPYIRGFLLALNWNQEIKTNTHEKYSLDDLMQELYIKAKVKKKFNIEDIEDLAGRYLGRQEAAHDINNYIQKGKTIPLRKDLFKSSAQIKWSEIKGDKIPQFFPLITL